MNIRSFIAHACRSDLFADARLRIAMLLSRRRNATTGRFFGSNLTKKIPQGCPSASGLSCLTSSILAAFAGSMPSSPGSQSKVRFSKSSASMGHDSSSRRYLTSEGKDLICRMRSALASIERAVSYTHLTLPTILRV